MMAADELDETRAALRAASIVDEAEPRSFEIMLELNAGRRLRSGSSLLDTPECVESLWGDGHQSIWAKGESFLLCGPDGVGKTTLVQQLVLMFAGIGESNLLGFSAHSQRRTLYLACDRPSQARRSFSRMVSESDRSTLDEGLAVWGGPLPFDLASEPEALLALARRAGADVVVVDALKDVAADLSREETGLGLTRAFQICCAEDVEVVGLHHQRKQQAGAGKPNKLADVYGSRWLTAGAGSVVMLWGEAGDPVVEFSHLKPPDEPVAPFQLIHDHVAGSSTAVDHLDAFAVVLRSSHGATAADVAQALYGESGRNSTMKAKRQLDRLVSEERIHHESGTRGGARGSMPDRYFGLSRPPADDDDER